MGLGLFRHGTRRSGARSHGPDDDWLERWRARRV